MATFAWGQFRARARMGPMYEAHEGEKFASNFWYGAILACALQALLFWHLLVWGCPLRGAW